MVDVHLEWLSSFPTAEWGNIRDELAELTLPPDQAAYGGVPPRFVDHQSEPNRHVFLVYADRTLVGAGSLVTGALTPGQWPLQTRAVQLRGLVITEEHQGQGIGTEVSRQLLDLAISLDPEAEHLTLTVNQRNPAAKRAYEKAGFSTLPEPYSGGPLGPEDIMYIPLA